MAQHEHDSGCEEYNTLTRRAFVGTAAAAVAAASTIPAWLPKVVLAQNASSRDIIVSVFLRGGADGLSMVYPFTDNNYYTGRPGIAIPRPDSSLANRGVALNGEFGISAAMSALVPAYQAGNLLVVHGAGLVNTTRSHFDAQRFIEVGKAADPNLVTGQRRATIVPGQALFLMNSDLVLAQAEGFAARVLAEPGSLDARIVSAWRLALCRPPSATEARALRELLSPAPDDPAAWAQVCHTLMMTGEFRILE